MKTMRINGNWLRNGAMTALLMGAWALPVQAQNAPLAFESATPMVDEFGSILAGTPTGGARVEILSAPNGVYPPDVDGQPHPSNDVLAVSHVGAGTAPGPDPSGLVSGAIILDRTKATKLFARVFNRETRELSSFYGDSAVYTNPTEAYGVFTFELAATQQPLDAGDDDGDGLNNSWEKSYGADKNNPDSDGDGVSDGDEHRAGTGLLDEDSYLAMIRVMPSAGGHLRIEWDSVSGKSYQLQYAPTELLGDSLNFTNVNTTVTALDAAAHTIVTNGASLPMGVFRVKLVE